MSIGLTHDCKFFHQLQGKPRQACLCFCFPSSLLCRSRCLGSALVWAWVHSPVPSEVVPISPRILQLCEFSLSHWATCGCCWFGWALSLNESDLSSTQVEPRPSQGVWSLAGSEWKAGFRGRGAFGHFCTS